VPGIGAFAIKPDPLDGTPVGLEFLVAFLSDFFDHQASKLTQSYRINYYTESTVREPATEYRARHVDFDLNTKPARDTQLLLGFVRDNASAAKCRTHGAFFCHAIEFGTAGTAGVPSRLDFDPFKSEFLVVYNRSRTATWIARIDDVRLVSAAERAKELRQPMRDMNAAYYYRFQLQRFEEIASRDVSQLIHQRPGKPTACSLQQFLATKPV
jgi:hypothetical protein